MEELKKKIVEDINNAHLPMDCVYYLVKDLFRDLEGQYYMSLQQNTQNHQNGGENVQEETNKEENKIVDFPNKSVPEINNTEV